MYVQKKNGGDEKRKQSSKKNANKYEVEIYDKEILLL